MSEQTEPSRLTFFLPSSMTEAADDTLALLTRLAGRLDIACVVLELASHGGVNTPSDTEPTETADGKPDKITLEGLIHGLQDINIAVLIEIDHIALFATPGGPDHEAFKIQMQRAKRLGCDGVHMNQDETLVSEARAFMPEGSIIGAFCGGSRHQAMLMAEKGADYIAFSLPPVAEGADNQFAPENEFEYVDGDKAEDPLVKMIKWWQGLFEIPCLACNLTDPERIERLIRLPTDFVAPDIALLSDEAFITRLQQLCGAAKTPGKEVV